MKENTLKEKKILFYDKRKKIERPMIKKNKSLFEK